MLTFPGAWRFTAPAEHGTIPIGLIREVDSLIKRIAGQGDYQDLLEHFKTYFAGAAGVADSPSSDAGWAETDLGRRMQQAAANAPLFIEAFYDACEVLRTDGIAVPDVTVINRVLSAHGVPFRIEGTDLRVVGRDHVDVVIPVPDNPPTLAEQAVVVFQRSLQRSDDLLSEGRDREAVAEILWLLETVSTAFQGLDTVTGTVEGTYFNQIVRELRHAGRGCRSIASSIG